jgi:hypothetical protein
MNRTVDEEKLPFRSIACAESLQSQFVRPRRTGEAATRSGDLAIPLEAYLRHMLDFEAALARAEAANGAG